MRALASSASAAGSGSNSAVCLIVPDVSPRRIESALRRLLAERQGKTLCPSEVARALAPTNFRALMPAVRSVAARLVERGQIVATQRGRPVNPLTAWGPIRLARKAGFESAVRSSQATGPRAASAYHGIDFRKHPEAYRVGRGEQGVLSAEPYKSELLPLWRFRTPEIARASAAALLAAFMEYQRKRDFVGMDMARKFLQMGFTRARRYANHASGRKYGAAGQVLPRDEDERKALAASHFREVLERVEREPIYRQWREQQRKLR